SIWDSRTAQDGCVDYVIKAILKLVGGSNARGANMIAVICIRLGSFKINRVRVSKHWKLTKKLVEK
ncbi:hypothetical protein BX616_004839, partial [Lobosporangium transversale]